MHSHRTSKPFLAPRRFVSPVKSKHYNRTHVRGFLTVNSNTQTGDGEQRRTSLSEARHPCRALRERRVAHGKRSRARERRSEDEIYVYWVLSAAHFAQRQSERSSLCAPCSECVR